MFFCETTYNISHTCHLKDSRTVIGGGGGGVLGVRFVFCADQALSLSLITRVVSRGTLFHAPVLKTLYS